MKKFEIHVFLTFILSFILIKPSFLWSNHDISTLKLLQIVHRHGDRTPIHFVPNDPFINASDYWPEGIGELTREGKYRMYKLGQFIRQEYDSYLGHNYSPREVYVRSSLSHRCLESVSLLVSGAYPPNKDWQWNNGSEAQLGMYWQPFPIDSFTPKDNDTLLDVDKYCPKADEEHKKILNSDQVFNKLNENKEFLQNLSKYVGLDVNALNLCKRIHEDLKLEHKRGYHWSDRKIWSQEYESLVIERLYPLVKFLWTIEWDNKLIERVRAGPLIQELVTNFDKYIAGKPVVNSLGNPYKLFLYSTHDSKLAVLMNALNVFNNELIPFSASLLFELHQNKDSDNYFVKLYYYNESLTNLSPILMSLPDCDNRDNCPFDRFMRITQTLIPNDWNSECGLRYQTNDIFISNIVALVLNIILFSVLTALIVYNCYQRNREQYLLLEGKDESE